MTRPNLSLLVPLALAALSMSGCILNNVSSQERLRDAVVGLNDEVRWNRLDLATQRVAFPHRNTFRATHHRWHRELRIADFDIMQVQTSGDESEGATSIVVVHWYDEDTMLLHETTLRQTWEKFTGGYLMVNEEVASGAEALLEIPEELLPPEDGEEGEETTEPTEETESAGAQVVANAETVQDS